MITDRQLQSRVEARDDRAQAAHFDAESRDEREAEALAAAARAAVADFATLRRLFVTSGDMLMCETVLPTSAAGWPGGALDELLLLVLVSAVRRGSPASHSSILGAQLADIGERLATLLEARPEILRRAGVTS